MEHGNQNKNQQISKSPFVLWFMGTNTSGKFKKNLALIGTLLSLAQNMWHQYKNEKNINSSKDKSRKKKLSEMVEVGVPIFFYFDEIWKMKEKGPNAFFLQFFEKMVKTNVLGHNFLIFQILSK